MATHHKASLMRIPCVGPAYAGRSETFEHDEIINWRTIAPIRNSSAYDQFLCMPVVGESLCEDNVYEDDWLIVRTTHLAMPGDLVVAHTPDGRAVKYLQEHPSNRQMVLLKSANCNYEDWAYYQEDIRILGVVRRVERDLILDGRFRTEVVKEFPDTRLNRRA